MNDLLSHAEIEAAAERLRAYLEPTPLIRSAYYSAQMRANVYFKLEMLQPTHSFKVRGAFNAMLSLPPEQRQRRRVAQGRPGGRARLRHFAHRRFRRRSGSCGTVLDDG